MSQRAFLAALAFVAFVSLGLPDGLLGVAWPSIRGDFGVRLESLGLLFSVTTAGYLTASFFSGMILRVMPIGMVLALSTFAAAAALLGFALSPSWPLMVALGFVAGLGGGAIDAGLNAYGATHFSARTLNWLHAFFGVGSTMGPLIVTAVLEAGFVWRWAYAIVGTFQLGLAATFLITRNRWDEVPGKEGEDDAPVAVAQAFETLGRPVVWLGMLTFAFCTGVEVATAQWSYSLLTLGRGMPETEAGLVVGSFWGSFVAGRVLFGVIADRVPLVATLRSCMLASAVGALLFWLDLSELSAIAGLVAVGFFLAPLFASLISLTPARVGRAHADSAIGFQIAAAALGGAGLTALAGILARSFGLEVIGLSIVVAAVALIALYEAFVRTGGAAGAAR